jgi:DotD protein
MRISKSIYSSLFVLLSGCASAPQVPKNTQAEPTEVEVQLTATAKRVQEVASRLSVGDDRSPLTLPENGPRTAVDMNFVGTLDKAAETLAAVVGYQVVIVGKPPQPVIVSAVGRSKAWLEIIQALAIQLGARGQIKVDVDSKKLEVRYG